MNRLVLSLLSPTLLAGLALAQTQPNPEATSQNPNQSANPAQPGIVFFAELAKSVDAKKAKVGDTVVARSTQALVAQGKVVIPQGSKIIGHVTQVKPSTKDAPQSELGIVFEQVVQKDGTQRPFTVAIQAVGAARSPWETQNPPGDQSSGAAASTRPSVSSPMGGRASRGTTGMGDDMGGPADADGPSRPSGAHLNVMSHGVVGLPGLALSAPASGPGSLITSEKRNVKLDSGTELLLRVTQ
jgi:lipoprotein-anchoring transpeptidase ErfK/SrfK